jgi:hypothetical protein
MIRPIRSMLCRVSAEAAYILCNALWRLARLKAAARNCLKFKKRGICSSAGFGTSFERYVEHLSGRFAEAPK